MNVKRCRGHEGILYCREVYPDGVPLNKFYKSSKSNDGLEDRCKICTKVHNREQHSRNNPKRKIWYKLAGSQKKYYSLSKEERSKIRAKAENVEWKINDKVVDITPRFKSEHGPSNPMTKRESIVVEGERIPQGWVYIVMNPDIPWILKVGKTYPDGISQIITSARRFGRAELVDKFWFEDALQAEKDVHSILSKYNLRNLDYQDCGMELFKCTYQEAKNAITKVQSRYDRPSIAVGK